jgi:alpha-mannosidase
MIGNAHVDPVWLWSWPAGVDEALATFRAAADRCDEYPEFVFTRGEAWLYRWVERIDPALSARVDELVERGRWHVTGGMVVQPDANLPSEAGWRRQLRHGRGYFERRFGIAPTVAYNVDTFGHPASLPDLLASEGFDAYVFHRPHPDRVALPAPAFRWCGTGGAEVLGCRIVPGYVTRSDDLREQVLRTADAAAPDLGHAMCFYGVGDHGGGPTRASIEWILEHAHAFDGLELRFSTPRAFFDAIAAAPLPEVRHELQHTFPGCYSVMHDVKRRQRRGELALERCERALDLLVDDAGERGAMHARLDAAWEDLLFCQFHDILAGTAIPSAWEAVAAMQGRAAIAGEELLVEATRRHAVARVPAAPFLQLVAINVDDAPWEGLVEAEPWLELSPWGERWLSDPDGTPIRFQLVQPDAQALTSRVIFPLAVEAGETARVLVRTDPPPDDPAVEADAAASPDELAGAGLRAALDGAGVSRLLLDGAPLTGRIGLHLRHDASDTWTWDADRFPEPVDTVLGGGAWAVEESGPLRARVRMEAVLGASRVRWTLSLQAGEPHLGIRLEVLWAERFRALQLTVELPEPPADHTDGLPGGEVRRAVGPTEWPVCGWSRVRADGTDVALVTPDAYSLSLDGGRWQWTLLRSPKMAWGGGRPAVYGGRDVHTDQGAHDFELELHCGPALAADDLHRAARRQCQPPIVLERSEGMARAPAPEPAELFAPIRRRRA